MKEILAQDHAQYREAALACCDVVYTLPIAEGVQAGRIFTLGDTVLFWHFCGFAYLAGSPDADALAELSDSILQADTRFLLITDDSAVAAFSPMTPRFRYRGACIMSGCAMYRRPHCPRASRFGASARNGSRGCTGALFRRSRGIPPSAFCKEASGSASRRATAARLGHSRRRSRRCTAISAWRPCPHSAAWGLQNAPPMRSCRRSYRPEGHPAGRITKPISVHRKLRRHLAFSVTKSVMSFR